MGDIEICKIHTDLNVADPLTKPHSRAKHDQHQDSMGVRIIDMVDSHGKTGFKDKYLLFMLELY